MLVALVLSDGVSADECEAFAAVFASVAECRLVCVAADVGRVPGAGGGWIADTRFDEVTSPDIVLVPGGLGCARSAASEPLLDWLRAVVPRAQWLVASSTGTVVVAAAGLLDHHEAATHWLAGPLLESYGSPASTDRVVEVGRVITCSGLVTSMHVALIVVMRVFGPAAVERARAAVADHCEARRRPPQPGPRRGRRRARRRRAAATTSPPFVGGPRPINRELVAPDHIEFDEPTITRLR